MDALPAPLAPLAAWAQFVTWFAMPNPEKPGKFGKFPCDARGVVTDAQNPANWLTAAQALARAPSHDRGHGCGVGFVFTDADPFFFLDIDNALQADGKWSPLAIDLCARFAGAAVEVSHSRRGLHIIAQGVAPPHGTRNVALGLELYTSRRFVALTGLGAQGDAASDHAAALAPLVAQYFPPGATVTPADWTTGPVAEWSGPTDDAELVRKALASSSKSVAGAFGGKATFADLWEGRVESSNEADQSLANHLAFWTGKDCERMERLMRTSALVRPKWDTSRPEGTYLTKTILSACGYVGKVATLPAPREPPPLVPVALPADAPREYLDPADQRAHFKDCYFLRDNGKVYSLHHNALFPRDTFDVVFGGHLFQLDVIGQARPVDSAWTAFTKSRVNRPAMVNDVCFRPELAPGALVSRDGWTAINSYVPYTCEACDGDVTPFLTLLRKLLPNDRDRALFLNWLASLVQNPGVKFQWWPVLQGVQGNGKSFLMRLCGHVFGETYSHLPNAAAMARDGMKFNSWVHRKLFIGIEEVSLSHKREFLEEFKVVVTNDRMGVERKGQDQFMADNRANGLILTNHKDGVPVDDKERRYAVFFTAQQSEADLARDGMDGDYFPDLYDWFYARNAYAGRAPGVAMIARYLQTFAIDAAMDPARLSTRAPVTTATAGAITASLGRAEQHVLDAIEEGRPGFAGGWVSSQALDLLLEAKRIPVALNKRRAMMQALGYDWHPVLPNGRVNDVVTPDGGKPKLYVRNGHGGLSLTGPADVARAYSAAQVAQPTTGPVVLAFSR